MDVVIQKVEADYGDEDDDDINTGVKLADIKFQQAELGVPHSEIQVELE